MVIPSCKRWIRRSIVGQNLCRLVYILKKPNRHLSPNVSFVEGPNFFRSVYDFQSFFFLPRPTWSFNTMEEAYRPSLMRGWGRVLILDPRKLPEVALSQGWVLEFAHSRLEPGWSVCLWYSLNSAVIHFMWWQIFWMAKLYHKDRWWLMRRANLYYIEAWTSMMTHSHGGLLPHLWQSLSLDFLMHSLWWQVFWIFALSKPCGSFTTKIVEGLQMNMILDRFHT